MRIQKRVAAQIELTREDLAELAALVRSKLTSVRLALRAQVSRWRGRYAQSRLAGIESDLPRGAPPLKVDAARSRDSAVLR